MTTLFITILLATFIFLLVLLFSLRRNHRLPPGPNPWPIIGNLPHMGHKPHQTLAAMVTTYGPILYLRLGFADVVVAASKSVAEQFLKIHDANFASRPPNSGAKHMAYNYQDLVFAPYGQRWRMLRKISSVHLFSAKALEDFKHVRQEEVGTLMRELSRAGTKPVNLGQLVNMCVINALGREMIGRRLFGAGADHKAEEFRSMVTEMMSLAGVFNIGDFVPALDCLDLQGVAGKMKRLHKRFDAFLSSILEEHEMMNGQDQKHTDMLSTLISLKGTDFDGDGGSLTDIEIKALLLNMFSAGTDTSASTVDWAIAELIRHPDIMTRAQEELDTVVGRERPINESDLSQLPYLQAVVKENFRLHPPTPLSLPHIASESCEINGYHIPKGSTLLTNIWAIARDPDQWSDPLSFRPERFLPGGEKFGVDVKGSDFELIPFGAGRRICAGLSLGLRTIQLLTATLVHGFDWELAGGITPEKLNMEEAYGITLQRAVPLVVHPKPRLAPGIYGLGSG
ncbi:hypothetical protein EUTSA_v10013289mg [Eutrema salsugineum]|uniref:Flavonoid 3'-monooxygenase n=1 Tax=Eutrema salsugineum TaxID=72664 RepID=V4LLP8_EUTSA|nr:flavonoid 3'-monooxygenase [Eutrema salsugineum]ESQ40738.1 hypothetical protein EUTSA_v10013289mg [Eutrema salsugineum]